MDSLRQAVTSVAVMLVVLVGHFSPLQAQTPTWESTGGPFDGQLNCLIKGPSGYLYGGTVIGVFRTPIDRDAWELVSNGILDREVTSLAMDSLGILYAGTAQGVFRSVDEGAHWEIVNFGLGNTNVHALQAAPNAVLLAGTDQGIYRSFDQAATWTKATIDSAESMVLCLGLHPSGLLLAGGVSGLMRSTDNGSDWTHIETLWIYSSLSISKRGVIAVARYGEFGPEVGAIGVSRDSGRTFLSGENVGESPLSVALDESGHLFVGGVIRPFGDVYYGHLFRYLIPDQGPLQEPLNAVSGVTGAVTKVFAIGENLAFACSGNLIGSTDSGATFRSYMNGLTASRVLSLADNGQKRVFAGTSFGLFHHADTSVSWNSFRLGGHDGIFPILSLAANPAGLIVAGSEPGPSQYQKHTFWCSTDYGVSWGGTALGTWEGRWRALAAGPSTQWFGINDRGLQRGELYPGPTKQLLTVSSLLTSIALGNSAELFAGSIDGMVYCSYDTGTTWISTQLVPAGIVHTLLTASGGRVYAGTSVGFFASPDRGSSWVQRGGGELPSDIRVLVAKPVAGIFAGTPDGVYHSSDEGEHWCALNDGLTANEIYSFCFGSDGYLYAGTSGAGVWRLPISGMIKSSTPLLASPPNGQIFFGGPIRLSWHPFDSALVYQVQTSRDSLFQSNLILNDSTVTDTSRSSSPSDSSFVGQGAGTYYWHVRAKTSAGWTEWSEQWRYTISPCGVAEDKNAPREFGLTQNYPNPFNPRTLVSSQLPVASNVRMAIYDVLGREVAVLVDERRAAGTYQDTFDGSRLSSGVYIYRLTAGRHTATRTMLLIK